MTAPRLRIESLHSALAGPFDMELAQGDCVAITGPSGSGKSLFLRMVADLDPNEGQVWLDAVPRSELTAPAWRRQVMYVPAESGWWAEAVAAHMSDLAAARALAARVLLKPELLGGPVARLSTGERQRLALVRALLLNPPVLLLDEPTSALDEASGRAVEVVIKEMLAGGTAILMVTHDPGQGTRLGARQFAMLHGRLEAT